MRRSHLAACAAGLSMLVMAPSALANPDDMNSSRLERMVTVEGITEHQKALQNIADMNGGNRHTRTAGLHRLRGLREGDAGEGGLRRALRDVQHAHLA